VRSWKLNPKDPMNLVIAADAALSPVDPLDDQIWEVTFGVGEPRRGCFYRLGGDFLPGRDLWAH